MHVLLRVFYPINTRSALKVDVCVCASLPLRDKRLLRPAVARVLRKPLAPTAKKGQHQKSISHPDEFLRLRFFLSLSSPVISLHR